MGETDGQDHFLPDFCGIPVVFSVVIIGQLLAFVLVLAPLGGGAATEPAFSDPLVAAGWLGRTWSDIALTSLFVQWVGLSSVAALCGLKGWLKRRSNRFAGLFSYGLILSITAAATGLGYVLLAAPSVGARDGVPWFLQPPSFDLAAAPLLTLLVRNLTICAIVAAVALRYFYVQHQWRRQLERQTHARIQALQSRIRPHFLFNSMNTIASFTRSRPELAEQVVEDLAELFRVSLSDAKVPVTLRRELDLCRQYLRIEALRLGERLQVAWDIDSAPPHALLPALTLQPLVENAVYHGIEPAAHGGRLVISATESGGQITVVLRNTMDESASAQRSGRSGNRMALDNVRERVQVFFGPQASFTTDQGSGEFAVQLVFPMVAANGDARGSG